ncbi:nucleotide disphospho-sugar-binding domain-containing protein [Saccharothrix saharensis]|uniref:nucleotide disphospho-sugar-binding domain-containing protein n=1 Tax=Saccharothrix saharensis TaxID=571190 RepID=UPI003CCC84D1
MAPRSAPGVHVIDHAPHQWLFPWMSAVVHHGGAGTTAAALAAGVPQVVCPFVADQPHWARCAHAVGVAPPPIRRQHLTATGHGRRCRPSGHRTGPARPPEPRRTRGVFRVRCRGGRRARRRLGRRAGGRPR